MTERGIRIPRAVVAVAVVAATVVSGAGVVSAHGGFAVTEIGDTDGAVGVPATYEFFVATGDPVAAGADSGADHERIDVEATATVDGEIVEETAFTVDSGSTERLYVTHAFESTGTYTLELTVTYSSGDWSDTETASTEVEVAPRGSEAALALCKDAAAADLSRPTQLGCHVEHDDGPLGGLIGGLVASWRIAAVLVAISLAVAGTIAALRRRG